MLQAHNNAPPNHANQQPQTWSAATLKALAQASALGIPVGLSFPPRNEGGRR